MPGRDDMQIAARNVWLRLLEPIARFALDSGLSIRELSSILREAAVRDLAAQQLEVARRPNISGIAASSGIPRGEISRILDKKTTSASEQDVKRHELSTRKVLAAWCQDPKFAAENGQPADLKMYGRGATFETLAKSHGRGIPTRAILDELRRTGAIEVCSSQEIRLSKFTHADRRISPQVIRALGDVTELLTAMLQNTRQRRNCPSVRSISGEISPNSIPPLRKEITKKSADFLVDIKRRLLRDSRTDRVNKNSSMMTSLVSVAILFRETLPKYKPKRRILVKRQNFRRSP
jgi:Family of unknown function (DUF6502)